MKMLALALAACLGALQVHAGETCPSLPATDDEVEIVAQPAPGFPEPRQIKVFVRYPGGRLENVGSNTGLMLFLHNWGGTAFRGAPDPAKLVDAYQVVGIGVDYLQSGPYDPTTDPPYDYGYYQALDALRALYWMWQGLESAGKPFAHGRIYATGGSGGGNVSLMANKLAPRTFACIVDLSGMAGFPDDIAYGQEGGASTNAGYSPVPASPRYLRPENRAIRNPGDLEHARIMKALGQTARIVVVHGEQDTACPPEDAHALVEHYQAAGLLVEPHFVSAPDGKAFKDAAHSLGDRTAILRQVADAYLLPNAPQAAVRQGPPDFVLRDELVRYPVPGGAFVISYREGAPVGRFEAKTE